MYCNNCGTQLPQDARFCNYCGTSVNSSSKETKSITSVQATEIELENNRYATGENLQEAISILYDMEQDVYATTRMIDQVDQKISRLGIRYRINEPVLDIRVNKISLSGLAIAMLTIIPGLGGALFGLLMGMVFEIDFLISAVAGSVFYTSLFLGIPMGITKLINSVRYKRAENKARRIYYCEYEKYKSQVKQQDARLKKEENEIKSLQSVKNRLMQKNAATKRQLSVYYDRTGIDKDYRNLVPIGYMKDYMRLGISARLHGPNGLNYYIRQELRADMLQMTMQEISSKLDVLLEINMAVFCELVSLNNKCDQIMQDVGQIVHLMAEQNKTISDLHESSKMNEYYNSRIAAENEYRNRMDTIFGRWT